MVATEKKVPSILVDETSFQRTALLADNIGASPCSAPVQISRLRGAADATLPVCRVPTGVIYSGMGPDFRVLVRKGQKKAIEYFLTFKVSCAALLVPAPSFSRLRCACHYTSRCTVVCAPAVHREPAHRPLYASV